VKEAESAKRKVERDLDALKQSLKDQQGDHKKADEKLKSERAVLVAFDTELSDLERDLKAKKQEIVDLELALKKLEHDIGLVVKEKSSAEASQENLEKQFSWITDENQYVSGAFSKTS